MNTHMAPLLIGIDGGGTSCRVALLYQGQRHEVTGGRANVSTDREAAVKTVLDGIKAAARVAGIAQADLSAAHAFIGLAGVISPAEMEFVATRMPFPHATVQDDRPAAVVGALGDMDGTVAGIGTGSFMARQRGGRLDLIGGWGLAIGDEASGGWLGRGLLTRTLHAHDGLIARSPLSDSVLTDLNGAAGIVHFSLAARPGDFAALAPRVTDAADAGDPLAVDLMRDGASHIERSILALGWTPGEPLCLLGGLSERYRPYLPAALAAALVPARGSALDGALALAARMGATS